MADYRVDWYYTRRDGVQITRWDWARNIDIARELVKSGRPYRSTHYAIKKGHAVIEHGKLGPWQKAGHLPFASAGGKWLRHGQPRSRCHDVRAPSLEERKSHFRRCGRLLARRGPPALPGSTVPAADSCGLSRSRRAHQTPVAVACSAAPLVMMCSYAQRCLQISKIGATCAMLCGLTAHILPPPCGGRSSRSRQRCRLKLTISSVELMQAAQRA